MNFNNWCNLFMNLQMLVQWILYYDILGNSKVVVCDSQFFLVIGGVNSVFVDVCQKEVRVQQIYNKVLQFYIDQFMMENLDWVDGDFFFYINVFCLVWMGKIYVNLVNFVYQKGMLLYVISRINCDVMFNYYGMFGNSYVKNMYFGVGFMYFFDCGYVGVSLDVMDSIYGVFGFLMENQFFGVDVICDCLVGVKFMQDKVVIEGWLLDLLFFFDSVELWVFWLSNMLGEYLGIFKVNVY